MVEDAQNNKAPIQAYADRIASYFVPVIILIAFLTWIFWFFLAFSERGKRVINLDNKSRFEFAFNFGISTLVVACPCALGLATPTAVMVGTGVAAKFGVLIKGADVFEKMKSVTMVIFDKTGTLTQGKLVVKSVVDVCKKFKYVLPENQSSFQMNELIQVL